jgi:hypothetical protein
VPELTVNKHLVEVQKYSIGACVCLDEALRGSSEDEVIDNIGSVLWKYVYLRREDLDEERVLALAKYLRREQLSLLELPADAVLEGRFEFGSPPDWPPLTLASSGALAEEDGHADGEESEWRTALAANGKTYYWNTRTRESRWSLPSPPSA